MLKTNSPNNYINTFFIYYNNVLTYIDLSIDAIDEINYKIDEMRGNEELKLLDELFIIENLKSRLINLGYKTGIETYNYISFIDFKNNNYYTEFLNIAYTLSVTIENIRKDYEWTVPTLFTIDYLASSFLKDNIIMCVMCSKNEVISRDEICSICLAEEGFHNFGMEV